MKFSAPLRALPDAPTAASVVAFVGIAKAPRLLASLAAKIPADIVPMPVERLAVFCRRAGSAPVPLSGVVVCVSERALSAQDRIIVGDLGRLLPVLRVFEDPREAGRTFFDRCRDAVPQIPRSIGRLGYRRPVVVAPTGRSDLQRLLLTENVSPGGLFLNDPCLSCVPGDVVRLRFPGLPEVPELVGRIRWIRAERDRGQPLGYGCAFDRPLDLPVRRLLSDARSPTGPSLEPSHPRSRCLPPVRVRRR